MVRIGACVGVDLGGSKIHVGVVDREGSILASRRAPTGVEKDVDAVLDSIGILVEQCLQEAGVPALGVGVGIAGQVDTSAGIVRSSPNLDGWTDVALARRLAERLHVPIVVANDMRAIAQGEWRFGAGRGVSDLVVLFVGTGIGGAVITGGKMLIGRGYAGELGHVPIIAGGRRCHCPGRGCLEAYASGWALAERTAEALAVHPEHASAFPGPGARVTAQHLAHAYASRNALAEALVAETGSLFAAALAGITNVFNPARIILGGGVLDGLPALVDAGTRGLHRDAIAVSREQVVVVRSELGSKAGVIGAAMWAWDEVS